MHLLLFFINMFTINIITIKKLIYIVNNIFYNLLQTVKLLNFDFFFFV